MRNSLVGTIAFKMIVDDAALASNTKIAIAHIIVHIQGQLAIFCTKLKHRMANCLTLKQTQRARWAVFWKPGQCSNIDTADFATNMAIFIKNITCMFS